MYIYGNIVFYIIYVYICSFIYILYINIIYILYIMYISILLYSIHSSAYACVSLCIGYRSLPNSIVHLCSHSTCRGRASSFIYKGLVAIQRKHRMSPPLSGRAFWAKDGATYFLSPTFTRRFQFMSLDALGANKCLVAHAFNSQGWIKVRRDRNRRIKRLLRQQQHQQQQLLQQQQQQQQRPTRQRPVHHRSTLRGKRREHQTEQQQQQQQQQEGEQQESSSNSNIGACLEIKEEGPVEAWEVVDECCHVLQQMFQLPSQPQPLQAFVTRWDEDPLFRCAYGYPSKVGHSL